MDVKICDDEFDRVPAVVPTNRHISASQLASLGIDEVAFVKSVITVNGPAFAVHAADGEFMAIVVDLLLALAVIIQSDMQPVLVH